MSETQEPDAFIRSAAFPRSPPAPRKATRFDDTNWKALLEPSLNLFPKPSHVVELLRNSDLRVFSDDDAGEVGDVSTQRVDMPMSFDQNLDI